MAGVTTVQECDNCRLHVGGEGHIPVLLPDGWGWLNDGPIVCPTCVRLGVYVDEVAQRGVN